MFCMECGTKIEADAKFCNSCGKQLQDTASDTKLKTQDVVNSDITIANGARLAGEKVILASDKKTLVLTNYRVYCDEKVRGASRHISIPLDSISACGLVTRSYPWLLAIPAIACLFVFSPEGRQFLPILIFTAIVFVGAYLATRAGVITIGSNGNENIVVPIKGMKHEKILDFVEAVIKAKLDFVGKL